MNSEQTPVKILVIDDTIDIINMVKTTLISVGYQVLIATNGEKGAKSAAIAHPDLILLDVLMPDIDGYETCRMLKSKEETKNIPVIFMSALTDTFDKVKAFQEGAVDYVTKPINVPELHARVKTQISLYHLQKQLQSTNEVLEEKVHERTIELETKNVELQSAEEELRANNEELIKNNDKLKKSEQELIHINEELKNAKEKAELSDKLKTEFLNNMSHEVRTPMNGIIGFADLLGTSDLDDERRLYYVKIIQNSCQQLLRIIDDIIEISVLETKLVEPMYELVNINVMLDDTFAVYNIKAEANKINFYLEKELRDDLAFIKTDKIKLQKALNNIVENALKFTYNGFVEIGYKVKNDKLELFVKDTGIGISEENRDIIFERFSQEEKEISRKAGGLGLGLSIAKENIELIGGKIELDSTKDKGSSFYIILPYDLIENKHYEISRDADTHRKILVAEDEEINYLFIEIILKNYDTYNFEIFHARNGEEAIKLCTQHSFDLVLMDLKMPVLDGFEATREIKKILPDLPIVAVTAFVSKTDREKAIEAGCSYFIKKPIEKTVFLKMLSEIFVK